MGETALVESRISDAASLVKQLDATGHAPTSVIWYFYDDAQEWRLLLSGKPFDTLLTKQEAVAYRIVVEALSSLHLSTLTVSDLKILSTNSPLISSLRMLIGTPKDALVSSHFSSTTLNGIFISEMIVMRSAS
jgi:hypothetical protein